MVVPRPRGRPPRIDWAAQRPVLERLCQTPMSLREMASAVGCSHRRLAEVLAEFGLQTARARVAQRASPEDQAIRAAALLGGLATFPTRREVAQLGDARWTQDRDTLNEQHSNA